MELRETKRIISAPYNVKSGSFHFFHWYESNFLSFVWIVYTVLLLKKYFSFFNLQPF